MTDNVVHAFGKRAPGELQVALVRMLARVVADIEAGTIDGLAIAASRTDGMVSSIWEGQDIVRVLAAVTRLQHRIVRTFDP